MIALIMGLILIAYGLFRQFTDFEISEKFDRNFTNFFIMGAMVVFVYNRKALMKKPPSEDKDETETEVK